MDLIGVSELDQEDVEFTLKTADTIDAVVVYGQVLNYLAEIYYERAQADLLPFAPFISKDMDYWGLREAAEAFSTRVGGECSFPPLDSQSPNAAVVSFVSAVPPPPSDSAPDLRPAR